MKEEQDKKRIKNIYGIYFDKIYKSLLNSKNSYFIWNPKIEERKNDFIQLAKIIPVFLKGFEDNINLCIRLPEDPKTEPHFTYILIGGKFSFIINEKLQPPFFEFIDFIKKDKFFNDEINNEFYIGKGLFPCRGGIENYFPPRPRIIINNEGDYITSDRVGQGPFLIGAPTIAIKFSECCGNLETLLCSPISYTRGMLAPDGSINPWINIVYTKIDGENRKFEKYETSFPINKYLDEYKDNKLEKKVWDISLKSNKSKLLGIPNPISDCKVIPPFDKIIKFLEHYRDQDIKLEEKTDTLNTLPEMISIYRYFRFLKNRQGKNMTKI